jgi:hypothetical protein
LHSGARQKTRKQTINVHGAHNQTCTKMYMYMHMSSWTFHLYHSPRANRRMNFGHHATWECLLDNVLWERKSVTKLYVLFIDQLYVASLVRSSVIPENDSHRCVSEWFSSGQAEPCRTFDSIT